MLVQPMTIPIGEQLLMRDITWQTYEQLLDEFPLERSSRINYSQGILEIMVPLPEHEVNKVMISDLLKILLEEFELEFWSLGSTTFQSKKMEAGLEADDCFYIEHEAEVRGKTRIDLTIDPAPDLALEIDITSRTRLNNYQILEVPEVWRFNGTQLEINILQSGEYISSLGSPHFPRFPLTQIIPEYLEKSKIDGRNKTMKAFRTWVQTQINPQN